MKPQLGKLVILSYSVNASLICTKFIEIEFVQAEPYKTTLWLTTIIVTEFVPRCKQWCYEWSSQLWLLRLSFYRDVNNDVMIDRRIYDYWDWVCTAVQKMTLWMIVTIMSGFNVFRSPRTKLSLKFAADLVLQIFLKKYKCSVINYR